MSETTTTNPSPSGTFEFSAFGAVKVLATTTAVPVALTDAERKQFADAAAYFSAHTNRHTLSVDFASDEDAKKFRNKVNAYADMANLTAGFPKHVAGHWTEEKTDPATGKITSPKKWIEDNGLPRTWNVGTNVTFRFAKKRDTSKANGPVTVTTVEARAAESKAGAESAAAAAAKVAGASK